MECFAPKPLIPMFLHPHKKGCRRCAYAHLRHPFRTLPVFGFGILPGFPLPARTQLFEEGGQQFRALIFQHAAGDTRRMVIRQCEEVHYGTTGTRLWSFAPNTTRGIRALIIAPAHIGQGSNVTYSVHCHRRQPPNARQAPSIASNSAWQSAFFPTSRRFRPRAITRS